MKIAILTEYYPDSDHPARGVYVHVRAAGYLAALHEVRAYRVRPGPTQRYEYEGVPVVVAEAEATEADLQQFRPGVIALHTPYPGTDHAALADSFPAPRAVWIHGYEAMVTALHGYHRGLARTLSIPHDIRKLWRLRRSLHGAAAVVYVSNWMRRTAERSTAFRHPLTRVIPNPVDLERFRPGGDHHANGRLRGLALRGLRAKYGLDQAVAAFAGLSETELTIVGVGPDADRLRAQIDRSAAPVTLEERAVPHSEVPALIAEYDYFVAPARTEAQGVAMCEAMACGLPVVATRAGGIPEFVRDGIDGFLVRPASSSRLRRAVRELTSEPERAVAMGRNAREHIASKCSTARVIPAELELLSEIAK